jgi:uncharacterized protein YPO0396
MDGANANQDFLTEREGALEQFRMVRLQTFNWGTFSGVFDFPISEIGFLFVGPSGSGKSTILDAHAALLPSFSTIVLDEAFDKADSEFTAMAMNIFKTFGFQMIVATPLKSVMTLEPFIGGACFVHIRDRKNSAMIMIEYDTKQQRLKLPKHIHEPKETVVS